MDRFCFIAIMLFAMQRNMVNCSIVDVINEIDCEDSGTFLFKLS